MSDNQFCLPPADSFSYLMLTLVALSGEFPSSLVAYLPYSTAHKAKMISSLKKAHWLYHYSGHGLRGLRLTAAAKQALIQKQPERFGDILSNNNSTSSPRYDVPRRIRLHRMAEALVMIYYSGVSVFPWEKPPVFLPDDQYAPTAITKPAYYSSFEVKGMRKQSNIFRNSRATGLILAPDSIYAVYNTAGGEMKWEYDSELRLKIIIERDLCQHRLSDQYAHVKPDAILLGQSMEQLSMLLPEKKLAKKSFVLSNQFSRFHYLTLDYYGEVVLQLLCSSEKRTALDNLMKNDLSPRRHFVVANDGFDEKGQPVLLAYTCDIPRIFRFCSGLEHNDLTGVIICFDYQEDALRAIAGNRVTFSCIDFDKYERSALYQSH